MALDMIACHRRTLVCPELTRLLHPVEEWLTLAHCCVRFLVDLEQRDNGARIVCRAPMWVTVDTTWTVDALPPASDGSPRCRGREDSTVTCPLVVRPFVKAQFKRTHSELPARIVRYLADERRQKEAEEKPASPTAAPA